MKVSKVSLFFNKSADASIKGMIFPTADPEECEIVINFRSIEAYKKFKNNPVLTKDNFDEYDALQFTKEKIDLWVKTDQFKELVKSTNIIYKVKEQTKFNDALLKQKFPITFDLSDLSFNKKMEIITDPLTGNNIFFLDKYTEDEELSLKEISEMYQYICDLASKIRKMNYSQLESIFYIYDALKNKMYNKEKNGDNANKSRGLNHVIKGEHIVCAGYSNYFLALSDLLELKVEKVIWLPEEGYKTGHASIMAFINDSKYQAHGIWNIDPTWDAKKDEDDKDYKNNLSHFLMPIAYDEREKKYRHLENPQINSYYIIKETMVRYHKLEGLNAPEMILTGNKRSVLKRINNVYKMLGLEPVDDSVDLETEYKRVTSLAYKSFPLFLLERVVNNVTPKKPDEIIKAMQTSCSYRCMSDDSKSIYRLIRSL